MKCRSNSDFTGSIWHVLGVYAIVFYTASISKLAVLRRFKKIRHTTSKLCGLRAQFEMDWLIVKEQCVRGPLEVGWGEKGEIPALHNSQNWKEKLQELRWSEKRVPLKAATLPPQNIAKIHDSTAWALCIMFLGFQSFVREREVPRNTFSEIWLKSTSSFYLMCVPGLSTQRYLWL